MLKKNLLMIAMVILGLGMTGNAFGQESKRIGKTKKSASRIQPPQPKGMNKSELVDAVAASSGFKSDKSKTQIQPPQPKGMNKSELVDAVAYSSVIKPDKSKTRGSNSPVNTRKRKNKN